MKSCLLKKADIHKGYLILVNQEYPIVSESGFVLEPFSPLYSSILLEKEMNQKLHEVFEVLGVGDKIVPVSGYRTFEEQTEIFNSSLEENGREFTEKYVALPNTSEHQTGLAIDLGLNQGEIDFICPSFPYEGICEEFRQESIRYGFIERYQEEKKDITKISKEEWHFRYVGYPHAKIIKEKDFCLEEYIQSIKKFRENNCFLYQDESKKYKIYYIPFDGKEIELDLKNNMTISGDNKDGFIVTIEESL